MKTALLNTVKAASATVAALALAVSASAGSVHNLSIYDSGSVSDLGTVLGTVELIDNGSSATLLFSKSVDAGTVTDLDFEYGFGSISPSILSYSSADYSVAPVAEIPAAGSTIAWNYSSFSLNLTSGAGLAASGDTYEIELLYSGLTFAELDSVFGEGMFRVAVGTDTGVSAATGSSIASAVKVAAAPTPSAVAGGLALIGFMAARRRKAAVEA